MHKHFTHVHARAASKPADRLTWEKYVSSFFMSRPATRTAWSMPTMLLWARWAVPKASLT